MGRSSSASTTTALSRPAFEIALEVLVANDAVIMVDHAGGYTPTPVVSHAILAHSGSRTDLRADGVVISPSHNPPQDGGIKYNPPSGGPAGSRETTWIQDRANRILGDGLWDVRRMPYERAARADRVHRYDYRNAYVGDLASVVDMKVIAASGLRMGVDPMGGASIAYWPGIGEHYGLRAGGYPFAAWKRTSKTGSDSTSQAIARLLQGKVVPSVIS
jgi:phosphoglucomutase